MKNYSSTLADAVVELGTPETTIVTTEPFSSADDPSLKKDWCLVDKLRRELSILYICPRTGHFLASERLSQSNDINPLEYTKHGKFIGLHRGYDISHKKRVKGGKG